MFDKVYIVEALRSPVGKYGGELAHKRPDDLLADVLKGLTQKLKVSSELIEDVIIGCANQAGEDNRNIARMSLLLAGLPYQTPGVTHNRLCASSLDALISASCRIEAGLNDLLLVGGVESMSRAPLVIPKASAPFTRGSEIYDTALGWRFPNPEMQELFPLLSMGQTAEEVAKKHKISRTEQDEFALSSHQKAVSAQAKNLFKDEIIPITSTYKKETWTLTQDQGPRADTGLEKLSKLRPVFHQNGTVTAGNSSSFNDGASVLALCSKNFLNAHKLVPLARITGGSFAGIHPNLMGLGPVKSTEILLKKLDLTPQDFHHIELNEAFAAQALGCIKQLKLPLKKVNPLGGAIALGHPLGCSGAKITTTLVHNLKKNPGTKGLVTMCVGVGQGASMSIESL